MNETLYNEEKLRNFLLGSLSEDERNAIEDRFLADEDFSAQLLVVEDELIEAYLKEQLSTSKERKAFERAFLAGSPRRRERVIAMKALIKAATAEANLIKTQLNKDESPSLWTTLFSFFRFEKAYIPYALAATAALIIFLGIAWLVVSRLNQNSNIQFAENINGPQTTPTASTTSSPNEAQAKQMPPPVVVPSPNTSPTPQPNAQPRQPAGLTLATTILYPTLVRDSNAGIKKIVVPSSAKKIPLQLNLERNDYKSYIVRVTTADGHLVWQGGPVYARTKRTGASVFISPRARLFEPDDYIIELSGVSEAGPPESFANYFLKVRRK